MNSNEETPPKLSIVMVTLNEEKAIAKVVGDIQHITRSITQSITPDAEILVIDSSTDNTAAIAESLGCRVIRQFPPQGYGPAMQAALSNAKADIVITIDCDDTYPVEYIPQLVEKMEEGFDLVNASRMQNKPEHMPWPNYLANWLFAKLAWLLCGVKTTDVHSGMRAYRHSLIEKFKYDPHGMALPVELLIGPAQEGYKLAEIFIDYHPRIGQTTLKPLEGAKWTLIRLWRRRRFFKTAR